MKRTGFIAVCGMLLMLLSGIIVPAYALPYVFIQKWGSLGTNPTQFNQPSGIAVDAVGNVYVADGNQRIQKFTSSGGLITHWGSLGSGDGQFNAPAGVAVHVDAAGNVYVYVADYWNFRIQKFNASGNFIRKWGTLGVFDGQFQNPMGVAVGPSGNVYVTDYGNHRVQKFDNSGNFITKWGVAGSAVGEFLHPWGIAVDALENVYVADRDNFRIQKFNSSGYPLSSWGSRGSANGEFEGPMGVAVDAVGDVYVIEGNHRVQKFGNSGNFITKWGSPGFADGQFWYARFLATDSLGNVYVSDYGNHRVQKFREAQFSASLVDIAPAVLHLGNPGPHRITVHIELPAPYNASNIDWNTLRLGTVPYNQSFTPVVSDFNNNGITDLTVRFDRNAVQVYILSQPGINPPCPVSLTITGALTTGEAFDGVGIINVNP